jgi:hypothetical protein
MTLLRLSIFACLSTLVACADSPPQDGGSRGQAAAGKADGNNDVCAAQGWYGDGYCDQPYCRNPDPDCGNAVILSFQHDGGTYPVGKGSDVIVQLSSSSSARWVVALVDRTLGAPEAMDVGGGFQQFRWHTAGFLDTTGLHTVQLELRSPLGELLSDYTFTADVRDVR